jgi:apolipoprotein N-acyltransferase
VLFAQLDVPIEPAKTFYTRYGEIFSLGCLAIAAIACALHIARKKS